MFVMSFKFYILIESLCGFVSFDVFVKDLNTRVL